MPGIGDKLPWSQTVVVKAGGVAFTVTPHSGKVRISYTDDSGIVHYWNGTIFVLTLTNISTTIVGKASTYNGFIVPAEVAEHDILMEGWINDDLSTYDRSVVPSITVVSTELGAVSFDGTRAVQ
jgi:hypothetical protein